MKSVSFYLLIMLMSFAFGAAIVARSQEKKTNNLDEIAKGNLVQLCTVMGLDPKRRIINCVDNENEHHVFIAAEPPRFPR